MRTIHNNFGRAGRLALTVLLAATGLQCLTIRTTPQFDAYMAPRDSVNLRSLRIALVPTSVPPDIENPEPVALLFDSLVEQSLTQHGFDIVPSTEYRTIWARLNEEAGGFFDPFTGERDEPEYQAGVKQLIKEMHERFQPDAFLYPELWIVDAPLFSDYARWDGTAQRVWPTPSQLGAVYATTFVVVVEDSSGTELFTNGRGLEVLEEYDMDDNEMVMLPRDQLFQQSELYPAAVRLVLGPLLSIPPLRQ